MATKHSASSKYGSLWSRDELILAFDLYCRIPFKKTKANNPEVIALSKLIGRSPASVARKLGNFGSFDPELRRRNISGLAHASKLDEEVWEEFNNDWNQLVLEAHRLREKAGGFPSMQATETGDLTVPKGASEKTAVRKTRLHQAFFRDVILSSYEYTCCITGLKIPEVLIASHIVPWSISESLRTDPHNGLCLSATFDRLFDRGLMTIGPDMTVMISDALRSEEDKRAQDLVCSYHGTPIIQPHRFIPKQEHLEWHRLNVFRHTP